MVHEQTGEKRKTPWLWYSFLAPGTKVRYAQPSTRASNSEVRVPSSHGGSRGFNSRLAHKWSR